MLGRSTLGYQNYEEVITEDTFYIDKTDFIKALITDDKKAMNRYVSGETLYTFNVGL